MTVGRVGRLGFLSREGGIRVLRVSLKRARESESARASERGECNRPRFESLTAPF